MVKKWLKTALLIVSVLLSVVLVCQIWFSSYFLPGGYDFFISGFQRRIINPMKVFFRQMDGDAFSKNLQTLFKPEQIVINSTSRRCTLTEGEKSYSQFYSLAESLASRLFSGKLEVKSKTVVDMENYTAALRGKSIYVDYGKLCDFRLFSLGVCGDSKTRLSEDLDVVRGYVISLQDGIMNDVSIYLTDEKSGNTYRYVVEGEKSDIDTQITELFADFSPTGTSSYSFELNFHKEQPNAVSKILFEPTLLMELTPSPLSGIVDTTPEEYGVDAGEDFVNAILRSFSVNTRTMWHYTDLTEARVFVENDATLALHPGGYLEYQAVGDGRGIELSTGKNGYDIYTATDNAMEFVTRICGNLPPEFIENLRIQTDMTESGDKQGVYQSCFDYCVGGIQVRHRNGDGYDHTIEMEIENGYLKSYRQYVKLYEKSRFETQVRYSLLNAADVLVDRLYQEPNPLRVSRIQLCYVETESGEFIPQWSTVIDGNEHIVG